MLNVIMLSVIMLSAIVLSVILWCGSMQILIKLNVIVFSVIALSFIVSVMKLSVWVQYVLCWVWFRRMSL